MKRRSVFWVLTTFLLTAAPPVQAQQSAKVRTIGFLSNAGAPSDALKVLRQALRDLG